MQIKQLIETPEGQVEFNANLDSTEVEFLLTFAINYLMRQGAIPFAVSKKEGIDTEYSPSTETHQ